MRETVSTDRFEADALFRSAFEFAAIGMALVAPNGRFLRVNRSLCEITGYPEKELLKRTFQDITHPDDLNLDLDYAGRLLRGEIETYQMEKRYFHKNGAIVWVHLSVSLVRSDDNTPLFFISQIKNITDRKKAEEELRKAVAEIEKLRGGLIKICAWTKQIEVNGRWIPVDEFLRDFLQLKLTHGISDRGLALHEKQCKRAKGSRDQKDKSPVPP
jgi:PAS domain S-box-containing protein